MRLRPALQDLPAQPWPRRSRIQAIPALRSPRRRRKLARNGRRGRNSKERAMTDGLAPGALVRHPDAPEWGLGQVQSAIGARVTVNFEHRGKVLIDARQVTL